MMKYVAMILGLVLLSACSNAGPDAEVEKTRYLTAKSDAVNVTFTNPALAKSVVGFRAVDAGLTGTSKVDRSRSPGNVSEEFVSADCKIVAAGYSATFTSPAKVNMPSFGKDTKPAKLVCEYKDKQLTKSFKPTNLSQESRNSGALAAGVLLCPICGVAVVAANGGKKEGDAYGFGNMILSVN